MDNNKYFIDEALILFQKLKSLDIDYCYDFFNCLLEYVKKFNPNNADVDFLLSYLCFGNVVYAQEELYDGKEYYVECTNDSLIFSNSNPNDSYPWRVCSKIILEYGVIYFHEESVQFINRKIKQIPKQKGCSRDEIIKSLSLNNKFSTVVFKFAKPEIFDSVYNSKISEICYYIAKSITVGEYLILDKYSDNILEKLYRWQVSNQKEPNEEIPELIRSLLNDIGVMASKVRSISRTIGRILENQTQDKSNRRLIRVEGFKNSIQFSFVEIYNQNHVSLWRRAIEAISLISFIDFAYLDTFQNIETLSAAYELLKELQRRLPRNSYSNLDFDKEVIYPNIAKAIIMLHRFLNLQNNIGTYDYDLERKIWLHDSNTDAVIRNGSILQGLPELNDESKIITQGKFETFNNPDYNDLSLYSKIGCDYYNKQKQRKELIEISHKPYTDICENDIKLIKTEIDKDLWTTSLLVDVIRNLLKKAEELDNCEILQNVCDVAKALLIKLEKFHFEYANGNIVPGKIERPFRESFYEIDYDEVKNIYIIKSRVIDEIIPMTSGFKDCGVMFMQSISTVPVSLSFIKGFIDKYKIKIDEISLRNQSSILQLQIDKNTEKNEISLQKIQSQALQLLGILGAFIALVSVGSNAIKGIPADRFFSFILAVTGCIAALLLCINAIFEKRCWIKYGLIVLVLLILAFSVCEITFDFPFSVRNVPENNTVITDDDAININVESNIIPQVSEKLDSTK